MTAFIYPCPVTGYQVQGLAPKYLPEANTDAYESAACTACGGVHLIDPKTGKVLGFDTGPAPAGGRRRETPWMAAAAPAVSSFPNFPQRAKIAAA